MLVSRMIFLKKNYFDAFPSEKHFKKQHVPHFQPPLNNHKVPLISFFFHYISWHKIGNSQVN
jgi:hypothetical protein